MFLRFFEIQTILDSGVLHPRCVLILLLIMHRKIRSFEISLVELDLQPGHILDRLRLLSLLRPVRLLQSLFTPPEFPHQWCVSEGIVNVLLERTLLSMMAIPSAESTFLLPNVLDHRGHLLLRLSPPGKPISHRLNRVSHLFNFFLGLHHCFNLTFDHLT